MKKQTGFTLIELVIVIIILGILAVTAAPKFLNLQDDARKAAAEGVAAAIKSGANLVYSKALLAGVENLDDKDPNAKISAVGDTIQLKYGYPLASEIHKAVDLDGGWEAVSAGVFTGEFKSTGSGNSAKCKVTYTEASAAGGLYNVKIADDCGN